MSKNSIKDRIQVLKEWFRSKRYKKVFRVKSYTIYKSVTVKFNKH